MITSNEAILKLKEGNKKYLNASSCTGDISQDVRKKTCELGQSPYATILTCSDSRVIPECIFSAGIGELFVIRVAGNVVDRHQMASIEYAAEHLGCSLVLVLGHNHCGAVDAAINHDPQGFVKFITDEIKLAIGGEKDEFCASCLNVRYSVSKIKMNFAKSKKLSDLTVIGAIYHLEDGSVEFL